MAGEEGQVDEWQIISKIAEMRSYIASDWPSVEERKALYSAIAEMEAMLKESRDFSDNPAE